MLLIIDNKRENASTLSEIAYHMGIISCAVTPRGAFSEISPMYKAVILLNPSTLADVKDFILRLREYYASIPIFAVFHADTDESIADLLTKSYAAPINSTSLIADIIETEEKMGLPTIGSYRLAGIDASSTLGCVRTVKGAIPFTKTETMILRYLMASYPTPVSASKILKYSFRQARLPELTGIRTHISLMNKKYRESRGENLVISVPRKGYVLLTAETAVAERTEKVLVEV